MTTQETRCLPPSERDWEVYWLVKIQQRSTRDAAAAFGISQTRVCQVMRRTSAFLLATTPPVSQEMKEQQLAVARQVAADRIDYFIREALDAFRRSQGAQTTVREAELQPLTGKMRTTKNSYGDPRYLQVAARLTLLATKLPDARLPVPSDGSELEDEDVADNVVAPSPQRNSAVRSPKGACSAKAPEQVPGTISAAQPAAATNSALLTSMNELLEARGGARCAPCSAGIAQGRSARVSSRIVSRGRAGMSAPATPPRPCGRLSAAVPPVCNRHSSQSSHYNVTKYQD